MMPSYTQNRTYANAAKDAPITVWGRAWGGTPPYNYTLDFGDGGSITGTTSQTKEISASRTYTSSGNKTVKLTVTDSNGATAERSAVIRVLATPTNDEKANIAIEKALLYLYRNAASTTFSGQPCLVWHNSAGDYRVGEVGAITAAFAENGHLPTNDPVADIYAPTVQGAVNTLLYAYSGYWNISAQPSGNPDSNGNGKGAYLYSGHHGTYSSGFGGMALVLAYPNKANAQATIIPAGPFAGQSIYNVVVDIIDLFSYSQGDGSLVGAWEYYITTASAPRYDGSAQQWPALLFLAAIDLWNYQPPQWMLTNTGLGFDALQNISGGTLGGIGYASRDSWVNAAKTGGALVGWKAAGRSDSHTSVQNAVAYIGRMWHQNNVDPGVFGSFYAMYGIKKGLQVQGVTRVATDVGNRDWYPDMRDWLLGDASNLDPRTSSWRNANGAFGQAADGSWSQGAQWVNTRAFGTAHGILVLTRAVTIPQPVAVIDPVGDALGEVPAGLPFSVKGNNSYHLDPTLSIVQYLWDFDASNGVNWSSPDATGPTPTVPGKAPGVYTITLRVRDNNPDAPQFSEATAIVKVVNKNGAPTAIAIPPGFPAYAGKIGEPIQLDGSHSSDPEGDPIISYLWDFNGDGTFGGAADFALGQADAATPTVTFPGEYTGSVFLRVCSKDEFDQVQCHTSTSQIDIFASPSDLYIVSVSAANIVQGISADLTVVLANDSASARAFTDVVVQCYNADPFHGGTPVGPSRTVTLPVGGTASVSFNALPLNGAETIFVYLDANEVVAEWDELNNVQSVNVSNQPPVAQCRDLIVSTDAGQSTANVAAAAFDGGSSDPDGDSLSFSVIPSGPYPLGVTSVTLTVSDGRVSSTCTATITVQDNEPPTLALPSDIIANNDPGLCGASVTFAATAVGNHSSELTYSHEPGSEFPVGTTVVTVTAVDPSGNAVSGSFNVTVKDAEAPLLALPTDITVNNEFGHCDAAVSFSAQASDNCVVELSYSIPSGSRFPVGTTVVTVTAVDPSGNAVSGTFNVTVKDAEAPSLACPANITVVNEPGRCDAAVSFAAEASDNCGSAEISYSIPSGSKFAVGSTTVTVTATDLAGNSTQCSFIVQVLDAEAPLAACIPTTNPASKGVPANGKENPDGFYQLVGSDNCTATSLLALYVKDSKSAFVAGPFKSGDKVKITQAPGGKPNSKGMAGEIIAHITLNGDGLLLVRDAAGNESVTALCTVPPKAK